MIDNIKTGEFIKAARIRKGLSQNDLAEKLSITRVAVSKWENGHNLPDVAVMEELAGILDFDINELLKGEYLPQQEKPAEKKKTAIPLIIIAVMAVLLAVMNIRYYVSWNDEAMQIHSEYVLKYQNGEIAGKLYYFSYDGSIINYADLDTLDMTVTDSKGTQYRVLLFSLSSKGYQLISGNEGSNEQPVLRYVKYEEGQQDYDLIVFYDGKLSSLAGITELDKFTDRLDGRNGSYYLFY